VTFSEVLDLMDVEHNWAFLPKTVVIDGVPRLQTFCNDYASVVCAAKGARLPPTSANDQWNYLHSKQAMADGWSQCSEAEARASAADGLLVVAVMEGKKDGHIGVVLESSPESPDVTDVTSAGGRNHRRCTLDQSFGLPPEGPIHMFVHPGRD